MFRLKGTRLSRVRGIVLGAGLALLTTSALERHGPLIATGLLIILFAYKAEIWMTKEEAKAALRVAEERRTKTLLEAYNGNRVGLWHRWLRLWMRLTMEPERYTHLSTRLDG